MRTHAKNRSRSNLITSFKRLIDRLIDFYMDNLFSKPTQAFSIKFVFYIVKLNFFQKSIEDGLSFIIL